MSAIFEDILEIHIFIFKKSLVDNSFFSYFQKIFFTL